MTSLSSVRALGAQLKKLRLEELKLRSARKRLIREREKLRGNFTSSSSSASPNSQDFRNNDDDLVSHLPTNRGLEASIALLFSRGNGSRDPRVFLDVTQRLLGCTVLSLAANTTGKWDPFDIKPQVFALGKHMALPVFTSIRSLREFCWKHDFSVRGPDGAVWAQSGCAPPDAFSLPPPPPSQQQDEQRGEAEGKSTAKKMSNPISNRGTTSKKQKRDRDRVLRDYNKKVRENSEFKKLLDSAAKVDQFEMKTVTPLHTWGVPRPPYFFHGYYGLLSTVLENATVLPGETDIVVNPATSLELALSHGLTSQHFARNAAEFLVMQAFQRVEKEIRKEFADFLSTYCPEVVTARSATIRKSLGFEDIGNAADGKSKNNRRNNNNNNDASPDFRSNADVEFLNENNLTTVVRPELLRPDAFDLVVLLETRNYGKTARSVQNAKSFGILVGHVALRVLPLEDAPAHVVEMCEVFYSGADERERKKTLRKYERREVDSPSTLPLEGLELMGDSVIVNSHVPSHSTYSDPRMAYTEAHAMALKKR